MAFTSNSSFLAETFDGAGVLWDIEATICGYDLRFLSGGNYYGKYFAIMKMTYKHKLYISILNGAIIIIYSRCQ